MAEISTELSKILSARYGEEVRNSIHDAILKINTVVEDSEFDDTLTYRGQVRRGIYAGKNSANDYMETGIWMVSSSGGSPEISDLPAGFYGGFLTTISAMPNAGWYVQYYISINPENGLGWKFRLYINGVWKPWSDLTPGIDKILIAKSLTPGSSLDDSIDNGWYFISSVSGNPEVKGLPTGYGAGFLFHNVAPTGLALQRYYPYSNFDNLPSIYRIKTYSSWSSWKKSGGGNSYTTTVNKTINENQNQYSIDCSPNITSDTNNYLAPTGDDSDVTGNILGMLVESKVCNLGPGKYYVKNLKMPENATISGSGASTEIILLPGSEYGIEVSNWCTVKNVNILGNNGQMLTTQKEPREQAGIRLQGQAQENPNDRKASEQVIIDGCRIMYCGYGILCRNTGGGTHHSIQVTNCFCFYNDCGIGILDWSEYHNFTNVKCLFNWHGVINNGGNNKFCNCNFDSNRIGFYMSDTSGESQNTSHGSVIGCTFNHQYRESDFAANSGVAVHIENVDNTFMTFTGCQFFYGNFEFIGVTKYAKAIFADSVFGTGLTFEVDGSNTFVLLSNSTFGSSPAFDDFDNKIKIKNCYLNDGTELSH